MNRKEKRKMNILLAGSAVVLLLVIGLLVSMYGNNLTTQLYNPMYPNINSGTSAVSQGGTFAPGTPSSGAVPCTLTSEQKQALLNRKDKINEEIKQYDKLLEEQEIEIEKLRQKHEEAKNPADQFEIEKLYYDIQSIVHDISARLFALGRDRAAIDLQLNFCKLKIVDPPAPAPQPG